jgi:hypothetical protein
MRVSAPNKRARGFTLNQQHNPCGGAVDAQSLSRSESDRPSMQPRVVDTRPSSRGREAIVPGQYSAEGSNLK